MENQIELAFKSNKLFQDINVSNLSLQNIKGNLLTVKEGEFLYKENDDAASIYLIVSGEINILMKSQSTKTKSAVYGENEYFGFDELQKETKRVTIAVALLDSYLIALSKEELDNLITQNDSIKNNLTPTFIDEDVPEPEVTVEEETATATTSEQEEPFSDEVLDEESDDFLTVKNEQKEESVAQEIINDDSETTDIEFILENDVEESLDSSIESILSDELKEFQIPDIDNHLDLDLDLNLESNEKQEDDKESEFNSLYQEESSNILDDESTVTDDENTKLEDFDADLSPDESQQSEDQSVIKPDVEELSKMETIEFGTQKPTEVESPDKSTSEKPPADEPVETELPTVEDAVDKSSDQETVLDEIEETDDSIIEELEDENEKLDTSDILSKPPEPVETEKSIDEEFEIDDDKESEDETEKVNASKIESEEVEKFKDETPDTIVEEVVPSEDEGTNAEHLELILKASQIINSKVQLDEVLTNIVNAAVNLTNANRGTLYLVDKEKELLYSKIALGDEVKEIRLSIGDGFAGWAALHNQVVIQNNVKDDDRFNSNYDKINGYETTNTLCYPINNKDGVIIGVLQLLNKKDGDFTKNDEKFLNGLSNHAAIAIENAKLVEKLLDAERDLSLNKMTSFLDHNIKKPLLVSKKYVEHLKTKDLPQEVSQVVNMVVDQITEVAELVQSTSSYSEEEAILRAADVNLTKVFKEYASYLETYLKSKNCEIVKEFDSKVIVKLNVKKFFQCYKHIIRNAVDAMPQGGKIVVATKKVVDSVEISFKDSGLGIPESIQDKIFGVFITHGKSDAAGLGLSITKKIVEDHNGTIRVESNLGEGATFIITLPVYK
jgi:signal transduction histidine kinase